MITEKMRAKSLQLFLMGIFALIFVSSAINAQVLTLSPISVPSSVIENVGSFTGTYNLTYTGMQENISVTFTSASNFGSVTIPSTNISQNESKTVTATFVLPSGHNGKTMTGAINATGTGGSIAETNFSVLITAAPTVPSEITTCTATGNPGELKIKKIDFTNKGFSSSGTTFGEDDQWFPFEQIEAEVQIKNDGNEDINNIELDWGIYNTKTNEWVLEMDNLKDFDLKDGDTKTFTIQFSIDDNLDVDLGDLSDGENYKFYVTATGEVDNDTSPSTCANDFEKASVIIESDFVILDNIQMPETLQCGESITVTANVWNIGDNDQDEVSVYVTNKALNLTKDILVGDINAFDNEQISFTFTVPKTAEEKAYPIKLEVYDEDGDVYKNDFDDDLSEFTLPLTIEGSCTGGASSSAVAITANLVSGGKAGEELVVKSTITNSGDKLVTYSISASGYGQWASSYAVEPKTLALGAGQSGEAIFTLNVNKDASGEQTFNIEVVSGSEITTQPVSVTITSGGLFGITGFSIAGNTSLWALGFLNVILVLVIIFVAIRITKKK